MNVINNLTLNKNLRKLYCNNNRLTSLILNDDLQDIMCTDNNLKQLTLNKYIKPYQLKLRVDSNIVLIPFIGKFKTIKPHPIVQTCTICLEDNDEKTIITDCKHLFHLKCITQITLNKCPNCRTTIKQL